MPVEDFESLIKSKEIKILGTKKELINTKNRTTVKIKAKENAVESIPDVEDRLITNGRCYSIVEAETKIMKDNTGLYCIRLLNRSCLPERYQTILDNRTHRIIYIGKAEGQFLYDRFLQELRAVGHGTFFRSIGAVLGFLPPEGSLFGKRNQNNYKFSIEVKNEIINWINSNLEISWCSYEGDFSVERKLLNKYTPLLNDTHNPFALKELRDDKEKCRIYARGNK